MLNASLLDVPRPFLDPIDSLIEAVGISSLVMERPIRNRTYALVLDAQHRGLGILHASEINLVSAHYLIGRLSDIPDAHAVVLISTRTHSCIQPGDTELLSLLSTTFTHAGIALHDWVVAGRGGFYCPRSLTDSPDPWRSSAMCL
jgi:hypothetical protein